MRASFWAAATGVFLWAGGASAEATAADTRATEASVDASVTARKLRKQWDQLRNKNAAAASCVEDKVAQALALANRIDRRRVELREAKDDKGRAVALAAIETLDAQRLELEEAAVVCVYGKPLAAPKSGTQVTVKVNPKLPPDTHDKELQHPLVNVPVMGPILAK